MNLYRWPSIYDLLYLKNTTLQYVQKQIDPYEKLESLPKNQKRTPPPPQPQKSTTQNLCPVTPCSHRQALTLKQNTSRRIDDYQ